jgi:hypothetical protein
MKSREREGVGKEVGKGRGHYREAIREKVKD